MYRFLRSKGVVKGITAVLGFFDDVKGGPSALVMPYAGILFGTELEQVLSLCGEFLTQNARIREFIFISKHM
jgi:hypothetical protein